MKQVQWKNAFSSVSLCVLLVGATSIRAQPVACLQKGKMDLKRPEFPSVTCWETLASEVQPSVKLKEACETRFGPWDIESTILPICPPKPLGSCFDVKDGQSRGTRSAGVELPEPAKAAALTHTHHYTPQLPHEWKETAKSCKDSGGRWFGPGDETSLLPF